MKKYFQIMLFIIFSVSCSKNKETINKELVGEWEWMHSTYEFSIDVGLFICIKTNSKMSKIHPSAKC